MVYCDDLVADVAAERFNVTWERTSPMVMSVRDDNKQTILSGECSFYFGRTAYGDVDAVKAFYFACSASFSPIEHYVTQTLFPGSSDLGSVTAGLGYLLNNGSALEIIFEGSHVLIREFGSNERVLVFDNNTGLLHDQIQSINGAFCYSNQQTEWASDLANELLSKYNQIINYLKGTNINLDGLNVSTGSLLKSCNGMLCIADLLMGRSLDDVYNQLRLIGLSDSLDNIVPIISAVVSGASDYVVDSLSDPKFLAGVAGGIMFEAGMIASMTGVGAPVGLALMGAGTLCTAYSCGLFDRDSNGNYVGSTTENWAYFGFSMSLNVGVGAYSGVMAKSAFKLAGSEVKQIPIINIISDSRGFYTTSLPQKYVVSKDSTKTAEKYLVEEQFGNTKSEKVNELLKSWGVDLVSSGLWDYYIKNKLMDLGII